MQSLCILGRQPALGVAELESLYGADCLKKVGDFGVALDIEPSSIDFSRLGGTVKFCKILTILDTTNWGDIQKFLESSVPEHAASLPTGKMKLGLSAYGLSVTPQRINATGLSLKKVLRASGRSARIIPNNQLTLNSGQVLHNQLTGILGWELIFVRSGDKTIVAQNIAEQDIEAYAARDQMRPKRDARVGMLPPKLAQIIINLAVGLQDLSSLEQCGPAEPKGKTILDPFCGTGVILQEAMLMGYDVVGSDLEPRMVDFSAVNLDWLKQNRNKLTASCLLEVADATSHKWGKHFDMVAAEAYLGRPFSAPPAPAVLKEVVQDVDTILKKFLKNLAAQTKPGLRVCVAVPAWQTKSGFLHLKTLDSLEDLGYTRISFVHANKDGLIYYREGQIVGRELVTLLRK